MLKLIFLLDCIYTEDGPKSSTISKIMNFSRYIFVYHTEKAFRCGRVDSVNARPTRRTSTNPEFSTEPDA